MSVKENFIFKIVMFDLIPSPQTLVFTESSVTTNTNEIIVSTLYQPSCESLSPVFDSWRQNNIVNLIRQMMKIKQPCSSAGFDWMFY